MNERDTHGISWFRRKPIPTKPKAAPPAKEPAIRWTLADHLWALSIHILLDPEVSDGR